MVAANEQYGTIEDQLQRFLAQLNVMSTRDSLNTSGVLSTDFWLWHALSKKSGGAV